MQNLIKSVVLALVLSLAYPSDLAIDAPRHFSSEEFRDIQCLRHALWHEARGEGELGIQAVASVILNRKNHPNYPDSFCKVIDQKNQFSFVRKNYKCKSTEAKVCSYIYETSIKIVLGEFNSILPRQVMFYTHKNIKPVWTRKMKTYMILNNHVFYLNAT